ncbi:MAG: hypothetical protein AAGD25_37875 [Cyanobacteria bacterium P01_F01_bin.150]
MEKQIFCLIKACEQLDIKYDFIDKENNVVRVHLPSGLNYFESNKTPFNTEVMFGLFKDKMHSYELLNSCVRMPKTISFLDFNVSEKYKKYLKNYSILSIIDEAFTSFDLPFIIKSNKGSFGINVYLCETNENVYTALTKIFDKNSKDYDYIALVQEFIATKEEYRLVCAFGEPLLVYRRGNAKRFNARYWENNEKAQMIDDRKIVDELFDFVRPVFDKIKIGFVGFDIIRREDDELFLIELNSPRFDNLLNNNGHESVVNLYVRALELFMKKQA